MYGQRKDLHIKMRRVVGHRRAGDEGCGGKREEGEGGGGGRGG